MRIAIIGAGISGLSCALECEKLGVVTDIYERDYSIGWQGLTVNFWPKVLFRNIGDPVDYLKKTYSVELQPLNECRTIIMKSPNKEVKIQGKMGYFFARGKGAESKENQLLRKLKKGTAIHYNSLVDFKELASRYDFVVVATGRDSEARELGVWEDEGVMRVMEGIAIGDFHDETSILYLNTEYAGAGYARITPFSPTQALVGIYNDRADEFDMDRMYAKFLSYEKLNKLEFLYKYTISPFTTGRVKKFRAGNVLLVGRSAGLTDRLIGVGGPDAIISGILAARAMILGEDYDKSAKPLQKHVENISSFRKVIESFENKDFDKLLAVMGTPLIKQTAYNLPIDFTDIFGSILKHVTR